MKAPALLRIGALLCVLKLIVVAVVILRSGDKPSARLHSPALGDAGRPGFLEPRPGVQVRPTWVGRHLHVGVLHTPARWPGA